MKILFLMFVAGIVLVDQIEQGDYWVAGAIALFWIVGFVYDVTRTS